MSAREPRKSGLSPSPLVLVVALVIVMLIGIGAVSLLQTALIAPAPAQTGAQQNALARATATVPPDKDEEPNYALTPTQVLALNTPAPLPPGVEMPTALPPPTAISYTPGPTASLEQLIPIEEWVEYVNEQQGFSFKYPPNWYLNTTSTGQTTQIFSYDFNDPSLAGYKGPPLDLTKIEVMVNDVAWSPEEEFRQDETIREWVHRRRPLDEGDELLREEEMRVDDRPALRQLKQFETGETIQVVYVKRTQDVILIVQYHRDDSPVLGDIFEVFVQNVHIH